MREQTASAPFGVCWVRAGHVSLSIPASHVESRAFVSCFPSPTTRTLSRTALNLTILHGHHPAELLGSDQLTVTDRDQCPSRRLGELLLAGSDLIDWFLSNAGLFHHIGESLCPLFPLMEITDHQAFQWVADGAGFRLPVSLRSVLGQTTSTRVHAIAVSQVVLVAHLS